MSLPLKLNIALFAGDKETKRFQFLAGKNPVSDDLNEQTITFTIASSTDSEFETIEKDIVTEGWVVDNVNKQICVVFDTTTYLMTPGAYVGTIRWDDQERTMVVFDIYINPAPI